MKRILLAACAGLLAVATAAPAFAADLPRPAYRPAYKAPMWVAPFSWTGFYAGINAGYGWGNSDWSSPVTNGRPKPKGGLVGGTLGYNLQTGVWVWGIETDLDASWIKGTDTAGTGLCTGAGCETRNSWLGTTRLRVGYAWDRWMPYFTGGAAYGNIKMLPLGGTSQSNTKVGWALGGGVEWAFAGPWSAKFEYLYADLGRSTCDVLSCGTPTTVSFKSNIVRLGVNYRFW
jgi:outer membrane immunogenic protein